MSDSKGTRQGNLPAPLSRLIGREADVAELTRLAGRHRLITLTGPGGVGKTRLAISTAEVLASDQKDGAWFCDLSAITEPSLVPHAIARGLRIDERAAGAVTETLRQILREKQLIVVIDNCEHLLDACARLIGELLSACPELRILATSREPMQAPGELVWTVAPLGVPDRRSTHAAGISRSPAVQLFIDRAADAHRGFRLDAQNSKTIAAICQRLDGMPLAIELCAARIRAITPDELLLRLEDGFDVLTSRSGAVPSRQRTMEASLRWSYELLDDAERALLRRLSVFAGSFGVDAVSAVCTGGAVPDRPLAVLAALVDKSLVSIEPPISGRARYRLLEPIRQFSAERLSENRESEQLYARHARHYLAMAEEAHRQLELSVQASWLERLGADHPNLTSALEWCRAVDPPLFVRLVDAFRAYLQIRGQYAEARLWLAAALDVETARTGLRASLLRGDGFAAWRQGKFDVARQRMQEALAIERERGDKRSLAYALGGMGFVLFGTEDFEAAGPLFGEELALAREVGPPRLLAIALQDCGILALQLGRFREARVYYEESLRTFEEINDTSGVAYIGQLLGLVFVQEGQLKDAARAIDDAVRLQVQLGDTGGLAGALGAAAELAAAQGRPARAMVLDGAMEARLLAIGSHRPSLYKASRERWFPAVQRTLGARARVLASRGAKLNDQQVVSYVVADSDELPGYGEDGRGLTKREIEVANLLAAGLTNNQIASKLHVSERTVDAHAEHIRNKLGVRSRAQMAAWMASRHGEGI